MGQPMEGRAQRVRHHLPGVHQSLDQTGERVPATPESDKVSETDLYRWDNSEEEA